MSRPLSYTTLLKRATQAKTDEQAGPYVSRLYKKDPKQVVATAQALLQSKTLRHRHVGAWLLAELGYPKKPFKTSRIAILDTVCRTERSSSVRARAVESLGHLRDTAADAVVRSMYRARSSKVRRAVAASLSYKCVPADVRVLAALASDKDALVREWAAFTLHQQGEKCSRRVCKLLRPLLKDPVCWVRFEAIRGLIRHWDCAAVANLGDELAKFGLPDKYWFGIQNVLNSATCERSAEDAILDCIIELMWYLREKAAAHRTRRVRR